MATAQPKEWDVVESVVLGSDIDVLLVGPPGIGKTVRLAAVAAQAVHCTVDTPAAELRGHWVFGAGGKFAWHDGPVTVAWRAGAAVLIDEIAECGADALALLRAVAGSAEGAVLQLPNGDKDRDLPDERLPRRDGFRVLATANTIEGLPGPLLDRFAVLPVSKPHPDAIASFPRPWRAPIKSAIEQHGDSLRVWARYRTLRDRHVAALVACIACFGERGNDVLQALRTAGLETLSGAEE